MNIKQILVNAAIIAAIYFSTAWIAQRIFPPKQSSATSEAISGSEFVAPAAQQSFQPLETEIHFSPDEPQREKHITTIETPHMIWYFSTNGAVVDQISYKRMVASKETLITPFASSVIRTLGGFLLALSTDTDKNITPYYAYELVDQKKEADSTIVTYKAETQTSTITKTFVVHDTVYKLDLIVTVEPKNNTLLPRIFFPAPFIADPATADVSRGVIYSLASGLVKKSIEELKQRGWYQPALFGAEDRYFVSALVQDPQKFAKRGYFTTVNANLAGSEITAAQNDRLIVILEGPAIKEKQTWQLSFYCGPKERDALLQVDKRLDGLLDYGWLAPISQPLLWLLNFFYSFLHNWGLAIIMLTVLLKLIMAPLALKAERTSRQTAEVQRKLQYLEQKYHNDPEVLAREKAELVRKHGASMLGCLPILLQIPIFIGLNRVLSNSIQLYKVPFLWMSDLSAKDPYYILPIVLGIGIALQTAQTGDARQRLASMLMALVVAGITANLSAGLALFIATSTLLGVAQSGIQKALKL